jgi:hypothetical protein
MGSAQLSQAVSHRLDSRFAGHAACDLLLPGAGAAGWCCHSVVRPNNLGPRGLPRSVRLPPGVVPLAHAAPPRSMSLMPGAAMGGAGGLGEAGEHVEGGQAAAAFYAGDGGLGGAHAPGQVPVFPAPTHRPAEDRQAWRSCRPVHCRCRGRQRHRPRPSPRSRGGPPGGTTLSVEDPIGSPSGNLRALPP